MKKGSIVQIDIPGPRNGAFGLVTEVWPENFHPEPSFQVVVLTGKRIGHIDDYLLSELDEILTRRRTNSTLSSLFAQMV